MPRAVIAATGPVDPEAVALLSPHGEVTCARDGSSAAMREILPPAVGLIVRGDTRVTADDIAAAPLLRVIGRTGAGYDSVDVAAAAARGIPVLYTPGANARAVAEGAMALILALVKRVPHWDAELRRGNWAARNGARAGDLDGAVLGIVGFGAAGKVLAELARPFGMTVLAHDPFAAPADAEARGARLVELDALLAAADVVSLHAALTPQTRGLLDPARLARMKKGAYLVNMARGAIVESLDALAEALESGRLAGAGLDVFDPEPPDTSHRVFRMPQVIVSPHALAVTAGAMARVFRILAEDMAAFFRGERPRFVVDPRALEARR